ncbi:hypothetical protein [Sulfitobacter guttiformis]|uniref:hypothetical protein n=1 Tax=Sulfitobacter guttiformis TaxID=74349 RepID=UPI000468AAF7|nr:hypothetical protein [Sulfitobacter guttiformis]KIN71123.1 hypothetical protein Z949_279 [Sulfitobacter guttiformis KCTC 32187]
MITAVLTSTITLDSDVEQKIQIDQKESENDNNHPKDYHFHIIPFQTSVPNPAKVGALQSVNFEAK